MQLAWKIRRQVDRVEVTLPGEKSDQNRPGFSAIENQSSSRRWRRRGCYMLRGARNLARSAGCLSHLGRGGTTHADVLRSWIEVS